MIWGRAAAGKKMLAVLGIILLFILYFATTAAQASGRRKVVVLLLDGLAVADLQKPGLGAFQKLAGQGAVGLLNTRTESIISTDRTNAYLTMGMGVRTHVPRQVESAANGKGNAGLFSVVHPGAGQLERVVREDYPNYTLGKIGEIARQRGITLAVVGNADTDRLHRESALMAMDRSGNVPVGSIGREVLRKDPGFPWGIRTDTVKLLDAVYKALEAADVVFIDFGDTARVEEAGARLHFSGDRISRLKAGAMLRADRLLRELLKEAERRDCVLMVVSPIASAAEAGRGNRTLTPVLIYDKRQPAGVLSSGTTRISGMAANIDIGPTIFDRLGVASGGLRFLGEPIKVSPDNAAMTKVSDNLEEYIHLKKSRYIAHGLYVSLVVAALVVIYWPKLSAAQVTSERAGRALASMVLALPAAAFLVPNLMGIKSIYLTMAVVIFVTAVLGCLLSYDSRRTLAGMAVLSLVASVFITADLLLGKGLLLRTPLGFDDVFMGGRYYGINNDCMGILIGSTAFSLFYFLDMIKANRTISVSVTAAAFALVAISQTPPFGANVGGTIAAGTTGVIAVMALATGKPLKSGRVVLTVAAVFMAELLVAYWDYRFGSPTHAGKVMGTLLSQGFGQKFLEVLESKLSLFGLMLVLPPWNLILAAEAVIYYQVRKRFKNEISGHRRAHPVLAAVFEVIFYGGLVAFAFNDTGVIATALMFTYLAMPVGVLPINTKIVNIDDAYHKEYKRDFR